MLLAVAAVLALFGTRVLLHPGSAAVGSNPANDFQIMTWSLAWWPWAFGHGSSHVDCGPGFDIVNADPKDKVVH